MAGNLIAGMVQVGASVTAAQNITLVTAGDGSSKIAKGNAGSTTQDILQIGADDSVKVVKSSRGTLTTQTSLSIDLNVSNNFKITPSASGTFSFSNIASAAGQSGAIIFVNTGNYTISKGANILVSPTLLGILSGSGTYLVSYVCDGTTVYLTSTAALV